MNPETLRSLRDYCSNNAAFEALQPILSTLESQYNQAAMFHTSANSCSQELFKPSSFQALLLNQLCAAVISTDLQGNIIYWNHYAEDLYQWRADEVAGKNIAHIIVTDQAQRLTHRIITSLFRMGYWQGELKLRRKDGSQFLAVAINSIITDELGNIIGFAGISVEALEQKQKQSALPLLKLQIDQSSASISLQNSIEGRFQITEDGQYLSINQALAKMYGFESPAEMMISLAANAENRYTQPTRHQEFIQILRSQDSIFHLESEGCRKNGSPFWVLESAWAVRDANSTLLHYEGTSIDITSQKQTQQALQQSQAALAKREQCLAALIEIQRQLLTPNTDIDIYASILQTLGQGVGASRAYVFENSRDASGRLLTSQRAEWCADGILPQIHNPLLQNLPYDEVVPRWAEVLAKGERIIGLVAEFPEAEQQILEMQGILAILVLPLIVRGEFFGFIGCDHCTEARLWDGVEIDLLTAAAAAISLAQESWQTEKALRESEARYRGIIEDQTEMICRALPDTTITFVNKAYCNYFGKTPEELIGQKFLSLIPDGEREKIAQQLKCFSQEAPLITCEHSSINSKGEIRWQQWDNRMLFDPQGNFVELQATGRDITAAVHLREERQQTEIQLQQQAERERLLGAIASRIRESLNLHEILDRTVAEVRQFLQADRVLIYRFDDTGQGILVAVSVASEWNLEQEIELHRIWHPGMQTDQNDRDILVINDVTQPNCSPHLELMQKLQVQAKLVVPILQGDQVWGVLTVHQSSDVRQWQTFETDLLEQLATQVAIAIQQAQLFSNTQQRANREQLLNHISQALNSSLDPEHILQEIVDRTGECFGIERVLIFTISDHIQARNEWLANDQVPSLLNFREPLEGWPDLADPNSNFNQNHVFYIKDLAQLPWTAARQIQINQASTRSVLCVPIFLRGELFGSLALNTVTQERSFTQEEIQLLQRIADQAAIALYNAQSYEHLDQLVQKRTQELEQEKHFSEAANRAKSEFLATMSHELRTPLNAVLGLSQVLQRELFGSLNPKQREYIHHIRSSGEHLLQLINDILDLAKVEAGRETLNFAPVVVSDLCQYCLALVREQAYDRGLQLTSHLDADAHMCMADERRLRQMLLNLLSNAIKFTPTGSVSLMVKKCPHGIAFTVEDTGIGIPPEKLSLLFQPFSQLDSQLNRQYNGSGLGLALTRNLARLHSGDITVQSKPGEGSQFTLYIPDLSTREADDGMTDETSAGDTLFASKRLVPGRILIVDDDQYSAILLQDYLQVIGHQVKHLPNGADFLKQVRHFNPTLILLDVQLSGSHTGLDLLAQLRSQPDLQYLSVVMVTAMAMAGDREKLLAAGANHYLSKPLDIARLELVLMQYLDNR